MAKHKNNMEINKNHSLKHRNKRLKYLNKNKTNKLNLDHHVANVSLVLLKPICSFNHKHLSVSL